MLYKMKLCQKYFSFFNFFTNLTLPYLCNIMFVMMWGFLFDLKKITGICSGIIKQAEWVISVLLHNFSYSSLFISLAVLGQMILFQLWLMCKSSRRGMMMEVWEGERKKKSLVACLTNSLDRDILPHLQNGQVLKVQGLFTRCCRVLVNKSYYFLESNTKTIKTSN